MECRARGVVRKSRPQDDVVSWHRSRDWCLGLGLP